MSKGNKLHIDLFKECTLMSLGDLLKKFTKNQISRKKIATLYRPEIRETDNCHLKLSNI